MSLAKFQNTAKMGIIGVILLVALLGTVFLGKNVAQNMAKASTCTADRVTNTQVTANGAVITWNTTDVTQGMVQYGTNPSTLTFSAPEASSGKTHNVPLTLLTPNTTYYYVVTIGTNKCDSTGNICTTNCVPWNFTTIGGSGLPASGSTPAGVPTAFPLMTPNELPPTEAVLPTNKPLPSTYVSPTTASIEPTSSALPSSTASSFCQKVSENIGATTDSANWDAVKQYDIDNNGIINGKDALKCSQSGK